MDIRKLQHIKGGSFTLSLPKTWVDREKIRRGDEIAVFEDEDGSLRLYPLKAEARETAEVKLALEDFPDIKDLVYCIGTYYIQGCTRIGVTSKKMIPTDVKKRLKMLRTNLPGVEVAEERADAISFQAIIDPSAFQLETLIGKTGSFSLNLQEDAVKSFVTGDKQLAREVIERSKEALRHYRMTIRQVALASFSRAVAQKVGVKNCRECVSFALIARDLNRLVYHSSSIASHFLSLEGGMPEEPELLDAILDLSNTTLEMQKAAVEAFLQKNVKLAIEVTGKMEDVRRREKHLLTTILRGVRDADFAVALSHIIRDLRRIAGYSVAIADDAMNRVLAPPKPGSS